MSLLYIYESGSKLGVREHRFCVEYPDKHIREIPIESIDSITVAGNAQLTAQCVKTCLNKGIAVSFFSKGGNYFGRLMSTGHVNTGRQRLQCELYQSDFAVGLAKRIIMAKIRNQTVVLRRYAKSREKDVTVFASEMERCRKKIAACASAEEVMGNEGYAARVYFSGVAEVIDAAFKFSGRSRRPPKDEFNSMINLGYSVLRNIVYGTIESKGMNPYFGFLHQDKEQHPTLASDLMEEWRAVLVDSAVLALINGHEIQKEHFVFEQETEACFLSKDGMRLLLAKLEAKLQKKVKYLTRISYPVSFRHAIFLQTDALVHAMEERNASVYEPIEVR